MILYWVRDWVRKKHFHILWDEGNQILANYFTKHHPIGNHITMHPTVLTPTQQDIANDKYRINGTGKGCAGSNNPGVTWKLDNLLKVICNIASDRNRNQWPFRLTVLTYM